MEGKMVKNNINRIIIKYIIVMEQNIENFFIC